MFFVDCFASANATPTTSNHDGECDSQYDDKNANHDSGDVGVGELWLVRRSLQTRVHIIRSTHCHDVLRLE